VGMIWRKSRIGEISRMSRGFRPAAIPIGIPMARAISTEARVRPSVPMLESHSPRTPNDSVPVAPSSASFQPPIPKPRPVNTATTPGQPSQVRAPMIDSTRMSTPTRIWAMNGIELRLSSMSSRMSLRVWKNGESSWCGSVPVPRSAT
jgi:hypothetical protein